MTISYMYEIASSKSYSFFKIVWRWKGSIWKSVLTELLLWLLLYYIIFIVYRWFMNVSQQKLLYNFITKAFRIFVELANYTYSTTDYLPLTFMLGFFVKIVVDRWRDIFVNIGFIDNAALAVSNLIRGNETEIVIVRRNILRYLCLTQVLVLRDISIKVRRRFPNLNSVVQSVHECELLEQMDHGHDRYWIPINWACSLVMKMREIGRIPGDPLMIDVINFILDFKSRLQTLVNYDWFDLFFPFMTVLQFIFYMGWLKVAEALLNPIALLLADEYCNKYPEPKMDNINLSKGLLYSKSSSKMPNNPLVGSAIKMHKDYEKVEMISLKLAYPNFNISHCERNSEHLPDMVPKTNLRINVKK